MPLISLSKKSSFLVVITIFTMVAKAQNADDAPKLMVGIVVDQMRYDYLERFQSQYTPQGFIRLIKEGFSFENNYLNYVPTNTAPGHASIYTGTTPSKHGIIGNSWYNKNRKGFDYCVYDASVDPVGTGDKQQRHTPNNLLVPTFTDHFKTSTENAKVISISIKNRAAVLSGGKKANAAYWFRGKGQGNWITSSYYMETLPKWVRKFNDSERLNTYMNVWEPLISIDKYTESRTDDNDYERGFRGSSKVQFPYNLKELAKGNGDFDIIKSTPFGNSYTLDFAKEAIIGESLGKNTTTDFLFVSLSSTDYVGHNFGVNSKELEDTYLRLDRELGTFLKFLDSTIGNGNYTLFLTADHGALENAHALQDKGTEAVYFKEATFISAVRAYAFNEWKNAKIIENISNEQVYLNSNLLAEMNLEKREVQEKIRTFINAYPRIALAASKEELLANTADSSLELLKNGYNPERGGDLYYQLEKNTLVYAETGSDHGSGYEYDTHVPLLFYGAKIPKGTTKTTTYSIDIMNTLAKILQTSAPPSASKSLLPLPLD